MRYLSLLALGLLLASCGESGDAQKTERSATVTHRLTLNDDNMFIRDSVLAVMADAGKSIDPRAEKLFSKGLTAYRKQKDYSTAIRLLKESIRVRPTARSYFEMGNAAADMDSLEMAERAYKMAELLNYSPLNKVLYNLACVQSRSDDPWAAEQSLVAALELGYNNLDNIYKDKDLDNVRKSGFSSGVRRAIAGLGDPDKLQWNIFYRQFEALNMPLQIDFNYRNSLTETKTLGYDFDRFVNEMRESRFSRGDGNIYYRVGIVKNTDSVKALIYAVKNVMLSDDGPATFYLASYNAAGKLIDKKVVGGHIMLDKPFAVAVFQESGDFAIQHFNVKYEMGEGNEEDVIKGIAEQTALNKELYTIADDGHFENRSTELGMR